MSVSADRWTCPQCGRTTVIHGSEADTRRAIRGLQEGHADGHAKADHVLEGLGLAGVEERSRCRRGRPRIRQQDAS